MTGAKGPDVLDLGKHLLKDCFGILYKFGLRIYNFQHIGYCSLTGVKRLRLMTGSFLLLPLGEATTRS